jgi:glycosyltransferase involved in cell wall biosynthesis
VNIGLTNEYFVPFAAGGAEWSLLYLARALVADGHKVVVITPNYGAAAFEEMDGVRVYRFPFPIKMRRSQKVLRFRWLANLLFYTWFGLQTRRIARREGIEILHAQNKFALPGTWLAARWLGLPLLLTIRDTSLICQAGMCLHHHEKRADGCRHADYWRECAPEYISRYLAPASWLGRLRAGFTMEWLWWDTALRRRLVRRVDGIVGVSQGILDVYAAWGLDVRDRARVIYNVPPAATNVSPGDLQQLQRELDIEGRRSVLFVGQATPGKGVPDLLAAAERVVEQVPDAVFLFVGKSNLQTQAEYVRPLGVLPNQKVLQLYQAVDTVVVPSVCQDALSRVILEAMASGVPVVGTAVGGTPEMVQDGVTGRLVPRHAPDALAESIVDSLTRPGARQAWGQAAKHVIESRFDPGHSVESLISFYREKMKAGRA